MAQANQSIEKNSKYSIKAFFLQRMQFKVYNFSIGNTDTSMTSVHFTLLIDMQV